MNTELYPNAEDNGRYVQKNMNQHFNNSLKHLHNENCDNFNEYGRTGKRDRILQFCDNKPFEILNGKYG
jgi:hypothetical protein